jgi:hypothetical protein
MSTSDLNGLSDGGNEQDLKKASEYTNIPPVRKIKKASDLSPNEVAEMVFDMMINHRIMESRIEKLENRLNTVLSNNFIKKDVIPYHG